MTDPEPANPAPDPKEAMRQALAAKKKAETAHHDGAAGAKSLGATHSKAAGKRQFRRKSGG